MPFRQTPATHTPYAILAFDKQGAERRDDPDGIGGLLSDRLLSEVKTSPPSDIFVFAHGWHGDMTAAIKQYDLWIDAKAALSADAAKMGTSFRPVRIGLHWPSEPWGDEELGAANPGASFGVSATGPGPTELLETFLDRLDLQSSLRSRELAGLIFRENKLNAGAMLLPPQVAEAYQELSTLAGIGSGARGSDPATDNTPFDAQAAFVAMNATGASFGSGVLGGLLAPFRTLSFLMMKKRARLVGEGGMFEFFTKLQEAATHSRVHLIGHSFGSIVMASICGGPQGQGKLPRPVDSLAMLQGAVSMWAFAEAIPSTGGKGYFLPVLLNGAVRGPILTTRSTRDTAIGIFYPAAVGLVVQDPSFGINPKLIVWGAVGAFGIQGYSAAVDMAMQPATSDYHFEPGKVYNLEASKFIAKQSGLSGAHGDINEPEVMHAVWQAAYTASVMESQQPVSAPLTMTASVTPASVSTPAPRPAETPAQTPQRPAAKPAPLPVEPQLAMTQMPIPFGIRLNGAHLPPIAPSDLDFITADSTRAIMRNATSKTATFGLTAGLDPDDLTKAGWGIIFAAQTDAKRKADIRAALQPLLDLRKKQAGGGYEDGGLFKIFDEAMGYSPGVSVEAWLGANGSGRFTVNPGQGVPYYLLLIGTPDEISFEFQYDLDSFFAVGRLHFDAVEEYARYADNIVRFEADTKAQNKTIALFNTRNDGDRATSMLHDQVAIPLLNGGERLEALGKGQGFAIAPYLAGDATKTNLAAILRGQTAAGAPAVLFTGSHGVDFGLEDPARQAANQGALLTQDWPGSGFGLTPDMYFTGDDVPADAKTLGLIHFFFACYGVACPQFDSYNRQGGEPIQIATKTMMTRLPQKLLLSGAQAVIGHVDRSWAFSFQNQLGQSMFQNFRDPLVRLIQGRRVGEAMDVFDQRWAALSTELLQLIDNRNATSAVPDALMANKWVSRDDARNYVILGDPAVRLRTQAADSGPKLSAAGDSFAIRADSTPAASFAAKADARPSLNFTEFSGAMDLKAAASPDHSFELIQDSLASASASAKIDVYIYSISAPYLVQLLKDAHERGADIRVMYDPVQMPAAVANQLRAFGLTVKVAPSHDPRRIFTVCHQKFVVIDAKTVLVESANWAASSIPERLPGKPRKKGNREWLVRIDDAKVAAWYGALFEADWNIPEQPSFGVGVGPTQAPLSFRAPSQTPRDFPVTVFSGEAMRVLPLTSPDNYFDSVLPLLQGAQKRIWLQQQYIEGHGGPSVPRLLDAVARRKSAGVDVRVIVSSRFFDAWKQSKSTVEDAGLADSLRAINLDFFTHCHNKGVIVDDAVIVSSTNWSENSIRRAREAGVLIRSSAVTGFFASVYDDDWSTCWTVSTADSQAESFSVPISAGEDTVEIDPADQV